jgi:LacI family transcriptional regulator
MRATSNDSRGIELSASLTRVALIIDVTAGFYADVVRGIATYARPNRPWVFRTLTPRRLDLRRLRGWEPHGIIAAVHSQKMADDLLSLDRPAANIGLASHTGMADIANDDIAIGLAAAEHLLSRGLSHFGYIGHARRDVLDGRRRGFSRRIRQAHFRVHEFYLPLRASRSSLSLAQDERDIIDWLHSLPKPAGVMACNDDRGWEVMEACRQTDLRIPEDVALIGVDNVDPLCRLSFPPLSSVAVAAERIGYEAAAVLDKMMAGQPGPRRPVRIPPLGVVTRQSTDVVSVDDAQVAAALRFIRQNGNRPLRVSDVARAAASNRRTLERKFRELLASSIHDRIHEERVARAKTLLSDTFLPMTDVAEQSGYKSQAALSVAFRRALSATPTGYRRKMRTAAASRKD